MDDKIGSLERRVASLEADMLDYMQKMTRKMKSLFKKLDEVEVDLGYGGSPKHQKERMTTGKMIQQAKQNIYKRIKEKTLGGYQDGISEQIKKKAQESIEESRKDNKKGDKTGNESQQSNSKIDGKRDE